MKTAVGPYVLVVLLAVALALQVPAVAQGPGQSGVATPGSAQQGTSLGAGPQLDVELVVDGLVAPLNLTHAPDDSDRRFVVDQTGIVYILNLEDELLATPFLDISDEVVLGTGFDERGLLELAFHPKFASNGKLYVQYSAERGEENVCYAVDGTIPDDPAGCPLQYTRTVSEFTVSTSDPNRVDHDSERVIFSMQWPGRKHNGGGLAFGPDGMLYIGLGDGGHIHGPGGGGSPFAVPPALLFGDDLAQDLTTLFGKILRIDVDNGDPYAIPDDNPLVDHPDFPDEIYAWGFRNPYRMNFDRGGDEAMYVSATAETLFEATYKVTEPGNYGWAAKEGTRCFDRTTPYAPPETCPSEGPLGEPIRDPVIEYLNLAVLNPQSEVDGQPFGRASLGGHIYRGDDIRWLRGRFVQGDFAIGALDGQILVAKPTPQASGKLWRLRRAFVFDADDPDQAGFMRGVGMDAHGELYAITGGFSATGLIGKVWKIVDGS